MKVACIETYATLCIYSDDESDLSERVFAITRLKPSRVKENKQSTFAGFKIPRHAWFLTSQDMVSSLDIADHIQWMLERIKGDSVNKLRELGCQIKITCYWVSNGTGGGPVLNAPLLSAIADAHLDIEFDIYFEDEGEA
jgi:hypothetical protein